MAARLIGVLRLEPYRFVDDLPFDATSDEVRRRRGPPARQARNDVGLTELDYGDAVYRFQDSGRLEEVTCHVSVLHLDAVAVPFEALVGFVRAHDPQVFERAGFIVSPRWGIAFDPHDGGWVTALAAHCLPQWRAL